MGTSAAKNLAACRKIISRQEQHIKELEEWVRGVTCDVLQPLSQSVEGGLGAIAEGYGGASVALLRVR
jgi:hypothetical protein